MPAVSGSYGDKPTLTFPSSEPSKTLQKQVLSEGNGAPVAKGDLLVADYLGQIWKGKVFDNSYDRKLPAAFPIGVGQVITGWDEGLVGVKAGSRVLLSIPPDKGYGTSGNSQAGISGTDTLVFVVDIVKSYPGTAAGDPKATPQPAPTTGPQVTGELGKQPTVTVPKGTPEPKAVTVTVLAKGSGAPVKAGLVVMQYEVVDWTGKSVGSTWKAGTPVGEPSGDAANPTVFDKLAGVPIGSRVLMTIPASSSQPAVAVAIDIIDQPGTAKEAAAAGQ
jgi:peptidylprolyl isomerase